MSVSLPPHVTDVSGEEIEEELALCAEHIPTFRSEGVPRVAAALAAGEVQGNDFSSCFYGHLVGGDALLAMHSEQYIQRHLRYKNHPSTPIEWAIIHCKLGETPMSCPALALLAECLVPYITEEEEVPA